MFEKSNVSVLILGVLVYSLYYPQPYLSETIQDTPIGFIDLDNTTTSRTLSQRIDASSDVRIAAAFPDMPSAQAAVYARRISGILYIPMNFERDLLRGGPTYVAYFGDASYFLPFGKTSNAINSAAQSLGAQVRVSRLIGAGMDRLQAELTTAPLSFSVIPLFNPSSGYATFVIPAAFLLVFQQILLMGVARLNTLQYADENDINAGSVERVLGKIAAYMTVEIPIFMYLMVLAPSFYYLPFLGTISDILLFGVIFILAVVTLAMALAAILKDPVIVQISCVSLGMPFFFLAGIAWPIENLPVFIRYISYAIPSTSGIEAFVRLSQMGVSLADIHGQIGVLCMLIVVFGAVAMVDAHRKASIRVRKEVSQADNA